MLLYHFILYHLEQALKWVVCHLEEKSLRGKSSTFSAIRTFFRSNFFPSSQILYAVLLIFFCRTMNIICSVTNFICRVTNFVFGVTNISHCYNPVLTSYLPNLCDVTKQDTCQAVQNNNEQVIPRTQERGRDRRRK